MFSKTVYLNGLLLRCKNSSFESLNRQLFAIVVSQIKSELSGHERMGLYSEVFNLWGKNEIKNYVGFCSGFFFNVFSICSLYLAACTFALISKFGPLTSKNPICAPELHHRYLIGR